MSAERYGRYYWCVKVTKDVSPDGEIYLHADGVQTSPDGSVMFIHKGSDDQLEYINLLLPAKKWKAVYAASVMDGHAVAIEHWKGEVHEN